jgi:hypothetical protein
MIAFNYELHKVNDECSSLTASIFGDGIDIDMEHEEMIDKTFLPIYKNEGPSNIILNRWINNIKNNYVFETERYMNDNKLIFTINSNILILGNLNINMQQYNETIINLLNDLKIYSCDMGSNQKSMIKSKLALLNKNQFPVIEKITDQYHEYYLLFSSYDYSIRFQFLDKISLEKILFFCDNNLQSIYLSDKTEIKEQNGEFYYDLHCCLTLGTKTVHAKDSISGPPIGIDINTSNYVYGYDITTYRSNLAKEIRRIFFNLLV